MMCSRCSRRLRSIRTGSSMAGRPPCTGLAAKCYICGLYAPIGCSDADAALRACSRGAIAVSMGARRSGAGEVYHIHGLAKAHGSSCRACTGACRAAARLPLHDGGTAGERQKTIGVIGVTRAAPAGLRIITSNTADLCRPGRLAISNVEYSGKCSNAPRTSRGPSMTSATRRTVLQTRSSLARQLTAGIAHEIRTRSTSSTISRRCRQS